MNSQKMEETLRNQGYRITNQRKYILKVFLEERENILSAQQIFERVLLIDPRMNFSTVYRNIEIFEELGMIHRINTREGYGSYKLNEHSKHHHHFICKNCGKTEAIEFCPFQQIEEQLRDKNFLPTEHSFEIFGFCHQCILNQERKSHE